MSRSNVTDNVTDKIVDGIAFARACVLDQRSASHGRGYHGWDKQYAAALDAIDAITTAHVQATKKAAKKAKKKAGG
jgi:hypothetical protein